MSRGLSLPEVWSGCLLWAAFPTSSSAGHNSHSQLRRTPAGARQREDGRQHSRPLPSLAGGRDSPRPTCRERRATNLSLGPWCAAPAGCGRSSGGCPRAAHSRSRPSRRPAPATARTPLPGWTRGPAPRGPLQQHSGGKGWARAPLLHHPTAALHTAGHLRDPRLVSSAASGQLRRGPHHLCHVPGLLQVHLSAGKHTEPLLNSPWHRTRGFYRLLLRHQLKAEGPRPSSPPLPPH